MVEVKTLKIVNIISNLRCFDRFVRLLTEHLVNILRPYRDIRFVKDIQKYQHFTLYHGTVTRRLR